MGAEARCELRVNGDAYQGKALLETDELLFRGDPRGKERGYRLSIPLKSISGVNADDGALHVRFGGGEAVFVLGAGAERWAQRITSPKSLIDKLDVKPTHTVSVIGVDDEDFLKALRARAARVVAGRLAPRSDVIFLGAKVPRDLDRLERAVAAMTRDGATWVVHPKGPNGLPDTEVFTSAKRVGLTYTKVARFSESLTAEKLVIPKARR